MKPGRNDLCKCGSGKKFKHCCERKAAPPTLMPQSTEIDPLLALYNAGHNAELERRARILLGQYPDFGFGWKLLGGALQMQGKDALPVFQKVVRLMPDDAEAHFNLGVVLKGLGQADSAAASYRRAATLKPDSATAHFSLGNILKELDQFDEAAASFRRTVELKPDFSEAHNNLGLALKELGKPDAAVASFRRALEIKPNYAGMHKNLGNALEDLGQLDEAVNSYRRALEINPDYADAHINLGLALNQLGQSDAALTSFRRALKIEPNHALARSNLLFTLNYTQHTPEYYLAEAREYGRMVTKKVAARYSSWQCETEPVRLRVGLLSGDLCNHPVGYFLESLLDHIDPARIDLIAYPTSLRADKLTARIKPLFSAWKPLLGLSDEAAARQIHADGVHVLLDLSGHSAHNRLPVFAWKPAPVQASWLGYWASTGVTEIDYLLADEIGVSEAHREHFSETVWHLPDTRLCFTPPEFDLPVTALPALTNGHITFGCFQNLTKVGNEVLIAWEKILSSLPNAKLRWQCKQFADSAVTKQLALRLRQHGIDPARVSLHGAVSRKDYLATHTEVDVILDTFPYPGGTTTCEALWMGVPTLTLSGDTLLARQGASLLTAAGRGDLVATNVADYIDKAIALASDLSELSALRASLREQTGASPLFDAPRFARNFEDALWEIWQARSQGNPPATIQHATPLPD